jgi:dienelactone hydrolase/DNA-directed RNA polymerase subunit RPC12/RpoP
MTFEFACGDCGRQIRANSELIGKRAKCPGCQSILIIPDPEPAVDAPLLDADLLDQPDPLASLSTSQEMAESQPALNSNRPRLSESNSLPLGKLAKRNWPLFYLLGLLIVILWIGQTGVISFASGDSVNLGAFAGGLALVASLLAIYGIAVKNFGDLPVIQWTEANLGKILIGINVLYTLGVSTGALLKAGQVSDVSIGFVAGMLVVQWGVLGIIMLVIWKLYERFGFFNVSIGNLTCAAALLLIASISLKNIANISSPLVDLSSTRDAISTVAESHLPSRGSDPPTLAVTDLSLDSSQLPELPTFQTIEPGIEFAEVTLDISDDEPGRNSTLYLYRPTNFAGELPCVFIAPAGAVPLAGRRLGEGSRKEHVPYVKAGFAVVAYEIDGDMGDMDTITPDEFSDAVDDFIAAKAGVANGYHAIEYARQKMPFVANGEFFTAGHSSAGTAALLLAAHHPQIKGCMAYAARSQLEGAFKPGGAEYYETYVTDAKSRLALCSPITHAANFRCPVHLFHTKRDTVVTVQDSEILAAAISSAGGKVEQHFPEGFDHYGDMIDRGIPGAIRWLARLTNRNETPQGTAMANVRGSGTPAFPGAATFDQGFPESEVSLPGKSDPDYVEKLVDCVEEGDLLVARKALSALAKVEPDDVESLKIKKRVAVTYKNLAFEHGPIDERKAGIRGIVKWGGKHSVPLLIKLLDEPFVKSDVFEHLGRLKDPRAARPVAQFLDDFHEREEAYQCLMNMGSAAEDVVIEVAPTNDPEISLAAINLLAEIGTEKCLPILRKAASKSPQPAIRNRAKSAITQVRKRASEAAAQ